MGVDIVSSSHLPDWIQNHAIIAGYFAREVSRSRWWRKGPASRLRRRCSCFTGDTRAFVPWISVRVRTGRSMSPIGSIPSSTTTRSPCVIPTAITRAAGSGARRERTRAGEATRSRGDGNRGTSRTTPESRALAPRTGAADPGGPSWDGGRREGVARLRGRFKTRRRNRPDRGRRGARIARSGRCALLDRLQGSADPFVRAVAGRILARSAEPFPDAEPRIAKLLADPHPRPRLEAVIAARTAPERIR